MKHFGAIILSYFTFLFSIDVEWGNFKTTPVMRDDYESIWEKKKKPSNYKCLLHARIVFHF